MQHLDIQFYFKSKNIILNKTTNEGCFNTVKDSEKVSLEGRLGMIHKDTFL